MSDITFDWMPFESQTAEDLQTGHPVKTCKRIWREDEFRSALDRYMADYQKHRAIITNKGRHQIPQKPHMSSIGS